MKIGNKLRKIRLERGMKQETMAILLDITQPVYNRYENNVNEPSSEKLDFFAEKLKVKKEDLLELDEKYIFENCVNSGLFGENSNNTFNHFPQEMRELFEANTKLHEENKKLYEDKIQMLNEKIMSLEK